MLRHIMQVVWLDTLAAKARFSGWIEGNFPRFGSFPRNQAPKKGGKQKSAALAEQEGEEFWIHLKRLR